MNFPFSFWKRFTFLNPANGYLFGGINTSGTLQTSISKMVFSSETTSVIGAVLPAAIRDLGVVTSSLKGYSCGGFNGSADVTTISALTYSGETVAAAANNLPAARSGHAGIQSSLAGYLAGDANVGSGVIRKLLFSNETVSTPSATVTISDASYCSGVSGYSRGYWSGGSGFEDIIDRFIFSNDSCAAISGVVSTAFRFGCGVYSRNFGYFVGGSNSGGTRLTAITSVQFSNDSVATLSANLGTARSQMGGCSSVTRGYAQGGSTAADTTGVTTNQYILFSNDSVSTAANALSVAKRLMSGTQGG